MLAQLRTAPTHKILVRAAVGAVALSATLLWGLPRLRGKRRASEEPTADDPTPSAAWLTRALRACGALAPNNRVTSVTAESPLTHGQGGGTIVPFRLTYSRRADPGAASAAADGTGTGAFPPPPASIVVKTATSEKMAVRA